MARTAFRPTEEQRQLVKVMSAYGIRQTDSATEVGLRSPKTLRKHFRQVLDHGRIEANFKVAQTLFKMATSGRQVFATIHWLNSQAGWRKKSVMMPSPVPDIDLLVTDAGSSTIVIAELKWNRKSLSPKERIGKEAEVRKGMSQLALIRDFLTANPDHLKNRKKLLKRSDEYEHGHYLLIPRDYCPWIDLTDGMSLVDFEAFKKAMLGPDNLHDAVLRLLTYEWLPVDGRDFMVSYNRAAVNGAAVESEIFYSSNPRPT
jgi:hypothetical protein